MNNKKFAIFLIFLVAFVSLVFAAPILIPSSFSTNTSVSTFYNITVNNSEAASTNITQVNVTMPSGFSFTATSNGTTVSAAHNFSNSTLTLSWDKTDFIVQNVTNQSFWFNATANATTVGTFNFTVSLLNNTGLTYYNITLTVNDTIVPSNVSFVSPAVNNSNVSALFINVSAYDNHNVSVIRIYVYNSTHHLVNNTNITTTSGGTKAYATLNITNLTDGIHFVNATAVDSSYFNNSNSSTALRVIFDKTAPSISVVKDDSSTTSTLVTTVTVTEATAGISTCGIDSTQASPASWTVASQSVSEGGFGCGTSVTRIYSCTDSAGNTGSTTAVLSTDSCTTSGSSSSSSASTTWKLTYAADTTELSSTESVDKELKANERVRVMVGNAKHTVGVKSLTATSATIEIASTPQSATFQIGETKKFDLDGNGYYDIQVTLNSISGTKANVSIIAINEAVPVTSTQTNSTETTSTESTGAGTTSADQPADQEEPASGSNKAGWIIGIIIVLIIIVAAVIFFSRKKTKK